MFNITQFRELIVKSTLNDLLLYSPEAEELLVFTCAVESFGGTFLHQVHGPALGIYQMEPTTHNDIWQKYLTEKLSLRTRILTNFNMGRIQDEMLIYDLRYATAMTRVFYDRIPEALPPASDVNAIWEYYKKYYNTFKGAAQKEKAIQRYEIFIQRLS